MSQPCPFSLPTRRAGLLALAAATLAVAAGCASKPDVRHDQDPSADLKVYKTFAFTEFANSGSNDAYAALLASRLKHATRAQLERRDYAYDEHDPDLRISLRLRVTDKQEVRSVPSGRIGWRGGWTATGIETVDVRDGTLAIDLVDARRNALVWHGVAQGRVGSEAMQQPGPAIEAAVGEIFARFPGARP